MKKITQEDRELLFIDLCGRLPYRVKCSHPYGIGKLESIAKEEHGIDVTFETPDDNYYSIDDCRPYLFPLSSMNEEQKKELDKKFYVRGIYWNSIEIRYHSQGYWDTDLEVDFQDWLWLIDWLNKNHFDYRGLIEKGLAIDASGLNIY